MEHFAYLNYNDAVMARQVEDGLNNFHGTEEHIAVLKAMWGKEFAGFVQSCLVYWAYAGSWDERNRKAVLTCRKMVAQFPELCQADGISRETQREAANFTTFAHRYIQNQCFKAMYLWMQTSDSEFLRSVHNWCEQQEFVFTSDGNELVKRSDFVRQ